MKESLPKLDQSDSPSQEPRVDVKEPVRLAGCFNWRHKFRSQENAIFHHETKEAGKESVEKSLSRSGYWGERRREFALVLDLSWFMVPGSWKAWFHLFPENSTATSNKPHFSLKLVWDLSHLERRVLRWEKSFEVKAEISGSKLFSWEYAIP